MGRKSNSASSGNVPNIRGIELEYSPDKSTTKINDSSTNIYNQEPNTKLDAKYENCDTKQTIQEGGLKGLIFGRTERTEIDCPDEKDTPKSERDSNKPVNSEPDKPKPEKDKSQPESILPNEKNALKSESDRNKPVNSEQDKPKPEEDKSQPTSNLPQEENPPKSESDRNKSVNSEQNKPKPEADKLQPESILPNEEDTPQPEEVEPEAEGEPVDLSQHFDLASGKNDLSESFSKLDKPKIESFAESRSAHFESFSDAETKPNESFADSKIEMAGESSSELTAEMA